MRMTGFVAPLRAIATRPASAVLVATLLLSACVDPMATGSSGQPNAQLVDQPAIATDATIYAARSDGTYTVPGLPVDQIPEAYRRQVVNYATELPAGTIVIDPTPKFLYYVLGNGKALRYGIAVGADGFGWSGESIVSNKRQWPTWTPPAEMIARKPSLEKWRGGQPGGPTNPLGSRAIYLTSNGRDYGYRIHGTPEWQSIGRKASSGCFRMINQDVMDLYERVKGGERVITLTSSGEMPTGLNIPKPVAPKKAAATPVVTAPIAPAMIGPSMPAAPAASGTTPDATAPVAGTTTPGASTAPAGATTVPADTFTTTAPVTPAAPAIVAPAAVEASPAPAAPAATEPAATEPAPPAAAAPATAAPVVTAPAN